MKQNEIIKVGAVLRQALNIIDQQETELNELRLEVRAFRAALKLNSDVRINNDELKDNIEKELHKLSHSVIKDEYDETEQTLMDCVEDYD